MAFRPFGEFEGRGANKRLSAHTIATFLHLQNVNAVDDLTCDAAMNAVVLRDLLRGRAIAWWVNSPPTERAGEPAWLHANGRDFHLTTEGLAKVRSRANGQERTVAGSRSAYNVSLSDIHEALQLIQLGPESTLGASMELSQV